MEQVMAPRKDKQIDLLGFFPPISRGETLPTAKKYHPLLSLFILIRHKTLVINTIG